MDFKDAKASYYNVMHMAGKIGISKESQPFQRHLDDRSVSGLLKYSWKQTPGKIMFGNRLSWCVIISFPYRRNRKANYIVERVRVQPPLLQVLRDLPVCMGDRVRWEVVGIEDFYTLVSGEGVEHNGFVEYQLWQLLLDSSWELETWLLSEFRSWEQFLIKQYPREKIYGDSPGLIFLLVSRSRELEIFVSDIYAIPFLLDASSGIYFQSRTSCVRSWKQSSEELYLGSWSGLWRDWKEWSCTKMLTKKLQLERSCYQPWDFVTLGIKLIKPLHLTL